MHSLDDLPDTVTRSECAITLTLDGARHDMEMCRAINEAITFDRSTISALLDQAEAIAALTETLRTDMQTHLRATAREWADEPGD